MNCPICGMTREWKKDMKKHIRYGHTTGDLIDHILEDMK